MRRVQAEYTLAAVAQFFCLSQQLLLMLISRNKQLYAVYIVLVISFMHNMNYNVS